MFTKNISNLRRIATKPLPGLAPIQSTLSFIDKFRNAKTWRDRLGLIHDGMKEHKLVSRGLRALGGITKNETLNQLSSASEALGYGKRKRKRNAKKKVAVVRKPKSSRRRAPHRVMVGGAGGRYVLQPYFNTTSTIM